MEVDMDTRAAWPRSFLASIALSVALAHASRAQGDPSVAAGRRSSRAAAS
jgi:hypothetical protein